MSFRSLAAALLAAMPTLALAQTQTVVIPVEGDTIVATLVTPNHRADAPVVLMLPAFGVPRDGPPVAGTGERLFARAAERLAAEGFASLRIDYRGTGESAGDPAAVTLADHVEDGIAALDWLTEAHAPTSVPTAVLGWSLGGAIAPAVARAARADALILLNPALDLGTAFTLGLGTDQMRAALADGASAELPGAAGAPPMAVSAAFLRSTLEILPQADLALYDRPVFMAVGTDDEIVFPQPRLAQAALSYHPGVHVLKVMAMDHFFDVDDGPERVDAVFGAASMFLAQFLSERRAR